MPLDDQDTRFEKALSRHLRAECPDAETLAAYHERALAPEEMIRWKKHIAGCGACQEVLAQLEVTEQIVAGEDKASTTHVPPEAARDMAASSLVADHARRAAFARVKNAAPAVQVRQMPKRTAPWRWAAPAGAIAAGLLVWLAVNEMQPPKTATQAPVQVAERRPETEPAAPIARDEGRRTQEKSLDQAKANELAAPESKAKAPSAAPEPSRVQIQTGALAKVQRQEQSGAKEQELQTAKTFDDKLQANAELRQQAQRKDETASIAGEQTQAANKPISGAAQSVEVTSAAPAPPPAPQPAPTGGYARKEAEAGLVAGQAASGGNAFNYKQDGYLREGDVSTLRMIQSAGGKATWRVGENGLILRSTEKATGWQAQASGVSVELTSGSAPSERVCWVVGREGTILRTTDGGEHWKKISSPIAGNLGGVTATDEMKAVVWDEGNHLRYETRDGGVTWTAAAKP
jgi:hypothetical protein